MLSALFAVSAAVKAEVKGGEVNSSIDWTYNTESRVLTLSGSGAMPNYSSDSAPWSKEVLMTIDIPGYGPMDMTITHYVEKIVVGSGITSIGFASFENATKLTNVELPSTVTKIGPNAFNKCKALETLIWEGISENLNIDKTAFAGTGLVQDGILYIGTQLVFAEPNISSVSIRNNTTKIHANAFADCEYLTSITIPASVTAIGSNAFANCTSLNEVVFADAKNIKTWGSNIFSGVAGKTDGDYKMIGNSVILDVVNTGKKKYAISPNVAYIAENAFAGCSKVEYLDLSDCQRAPALATGALTDVPTTKTTLVSLGYEGNFGSSWGNVNTTKIQIYNNRFVSRTFLHNAVVPSDVAVYRAEVADNKVKLIKVENHGNPVIVEAGVGVFLRTTATGEKEFKTGGLSDCTGNGLKSNNKLVGVKEDVTLKAGENAYIIATVNGVQDFYLVNGDYPLSMGKAYLDGTELSGSKLQFMDTDGIDEISSAPMHKTQIFNINGQRLSSPKEGLNIINGKKVIVNN